MPAARKASRPRRRSKPERAVGVAARVGLAARGCFYLLLAALVLNLAASGGRGDGREADAHGALETVASTPAGMVVIVAVAVGFFAFGLVRIWTAWHDREPSTWRRTTTALQGVFYVGLAWIPVSYALGRHSVGSSSSQQHMVGDLLELPAGRVIVCALGVVVFVVCANQIRTAVTSEYADGLQIDRAPRWIRKVIHGAAIVGIPARALVFLPVGVFLIVAAVQSDSSKADGLDQILAKVPREWWGDLLLTLVALGLLVFATYSLLEARYRHVMRAR